MSVLGFCFVEKGKYWSFHFRDNIYACKISMQYRKL